MLADAAITGSIVLVVVLSCLFDLKWSQSNRPAAYRSKRFRNWLPVGACYSLFYMSRYNLAAINLHAVRRQLGFTHYSIPLGQWHALISCYGRHRRPVARSNWLVWPTPQAGGTL